MPAWITSLLRRTRHADAAGRFRDDHLMAAERRLAREREPDHAGPDNQNLH